MEHCDLVHDWFGLTYASYLVLPRVILQEMPASWQERFVACLNELNEAWADEAFPDYRVRRVEGECNRACDACSEAPRPSRPDCQCVDGCEHEVPDPLSDYRHPHMPEIDRLRAPCAGEA